MLQSLGNKGIKLSNPAVAIVFSEQDLSIDAFLELMEEQGYLYESAESETEYIKGFKKRQNLPTGAIGLLDTKPQMRGQTWPTMANRTDALSGEFSRRDSGLWVRSLGVVAAEQSYFQLSNVRNGLRADGGLAVYTPDVTAGGDVAGVVDWSARGQVSAGRWRGFGVSDVGSFPAVVENPQA
jgi:hypothetical protein